MSANSVSALSGEVSAVGSSLLACAAVRAVRQCRAVYPRGSGAATAAAYHASVTPVGGAHSLNNFACPSPCHRRCYCLTASYGPHSIKA